MASAFVVSSSNKCHATSNRCLTSSNKDATRNKCIATSNRCLTSSNKKLVVTGALLVVTRTLLGTSILRTNTLQCPAAAPKLRTQPWTVLPLCEEGIEALAKAIPRSPWP